MVSHFNFHFLIINGFEHLSTCVGSIKSFFLNVSKSFVHFSMELVIILLIFSLLLIFREKGEREKGTLITLIYAFISLFLYVP